MPGAVRGGAAGGTDGTEFPRWPAGSTKVVALIGDPVAHSLSPFIHNAAFQALGLDWIYVVLPVPAGRGEDAVRALHALGLAGLNVTMPHKEAAAQACDDLTPDARALHSVNAVSVGEGARLLGNSTDGEGFLAALDDEGVDVTGQRALVFGAGGAGRAVVLALGRRGAKVCVAGRNIALTQMAADLAPESEAVELGKVESQVRAADVIINATPVGMRQEPPVFDVAWMNQRQVVIDLIYWPTQTPLLHAARAAGARAINGEGMLVHQAALSFTCWTGVEAPLGVMRQAAQQAVRQAALQR